MSAMLHLLFFAAVFSLLWTGCTSPTEEDDPPLPPPALALSVEARPSVIPADGNSRLVIFTELRMNGQAAPDSTEVILLHTKGTLGRGIVYTRGGVALDTLRSDTAAGTGWIIAYSRGVRDSVEIMFTAR